MIVNNDEQFEIQLSYDDINFSIQLESPETDYPEYTELIQSLISFKFLDFDQQCVNPAVPLIPKRNKDKPEDSGCFSDNSFEPKGNGKFWLNYTPTKLHGSFDPSLKTN